MIVIPMIHSNDRQHIVMIVRCLTAVPRAVAYLVGGVLGAITAGFWTGWNDTP